MPGFTEPTIDVLKGTFARLRSSFQRGDTMSIARRKFTLKQLRNELIAREADINEAVRRDLGLNPAFAYLSGNMQLISEIDYTLRKLDYWARPVKKEVPFLMFPSKNYEVNEPLGMVLVIGAWNYPLGTTLLPVISAIAAGNCVVAKPSEHAPHSAKVIAEIMNSLDANCFTGIEGGVPTSVALNKMAFDLVVFTGGTATGKYIMKDSADNLSKLLLELGGKNPVVVDPSANLDLTAKRIANMKILNAGQTCITSDMIYVHAQIKDQFLQELIRHYRLILGNDAYGNQDYAKIINEFHTKRVLKYLEGQASKIVYQAGTPDPSFNFVPPTILFEPDENSLLCKEEIFGPILPVFQFNSIQEVVDKINAGDKPLAVYYFGETGSPNFEKLKRETSSGALVSNDIGMQYANYANGFGGVGMSGVGKIRGIEGFRYCSNQKVVVERSSNPLFDINFRYAPTSESSYKKLKFLGNNLGGYTIDEILCWATRIFGSLLIIGIVWYLFKKGIVVINL